MSESPQRRSPLQYPRRWPAFLDRIVSLAVRPGDRPDLIRTKRLFAAALWLSLFTTTATAYQLVASGAPTAGALLAIPVAASAIALAAMWRDPTTYPAVMHVVAAGSIITIFAVMVTLGGVFESAGNTLGGFLVVIGAAAIFADRRAHFWLVAFVLTTIAGFVVSRNVEPLYVLPNRDWFTLFNMLVVGTFVYAVLYYFVRQSNRLYRQADDLLLNVLPDEIAERLKRSETMIAEEFGSASILFADVAGFSAMVAEREPAEVISILNDVFTTFDEMVTVRGLEKIKTIGDAYMVASGVPVARDDHAVAICDLALEMEHSLMTRDFGGLPIEMRIGIASGPVTAGIIGRRKFSYDLWGDTVNLASRMESTGTPGRAQVTEHTRLLAGHEFVFEVRGIVDVKGRGPMNTWYLLGRR